MTEWNSVCPRVRRLACDDEVTRYMYLEDNHDDDEVTRHMLKIIMVIIR